VVGVTAEASEEVRACRSDICGPCCFYLVSFVAMQEGVRLGDAVARAEGVAADHEVAVAGEAAAAAAAVPGGTWTTYLSFVLLCHL
jgi:hypothetical protein